MGYRNRLRKEAIRAGEVSSIAHSQAHRQRRRPAEPIEIGFANDIVVMSEKWYTAKKAYHCGGYGDREQCQTEIQLGGRYYRQSFIDLDETGPRGKRGKYHAIILCAKCAALRAEYLDEAFRVLEGV